MSEVRHLLREYRRIEVELGQTFVTPLVSELVAKHGLNPYVYLARAVVRDWGEVSFEQVLDNERALKTGQGEILCQYDLEPGLPTQRPLQIVIEQQPSATTTIKLAME